MNIEFRTETKGTTRKHRRCAREYKKFVLKADSLSRAQRESLRSWDPDVIVTPPKRIITDGKMSLFLRSEWDRCEKLENAIQPHMRMVHAFLSNSLKKNNMKPFRTMKEEKRGLQSKYPKTEEVWKGMTRHPKYARHKSQENRILTMEEDSLLQM